MSFAYILQSFGLTPRITGRSEDLIVQSGRFISFLVIYPTLYHLVGDITTNMANMQWFHELTRVSKTSYALFITMFLSHFADDDFLKYSTPLEFILIAIIGWKLNSLFTEAMENDEASMMDVRSTIFARTFLFAGMAISTFH